MAVCRALERKCTFGYMRTEAQENQTFADQKTTNINRV